MGTEISAKQIERAVEAHAEELVELTQDLIRAASITGNEGRVQDLIAERLHAMGLEVDMWVPDVEELARHPAFFPVDGLDFSGRPNVVGICRGTGGGRSLILNGHVDTIPVEPITSWSRGPFGGEIAEGRVYGRGASDMKGGLAAMTMALRVLLGLGLRPRGDVLLEYVVDEELTGYGTLSAIQRGYRADAGICLETSDLHVQPACIGRLWFTLTVRGHAVSVSRHWEGVSAIDKAIKFVDAFKELEQFRRDTLSHPLYPDNRYALPCNVFMFHAGSFPSAVPDTAVLRGSLGTLPHEDLEGVKRQVVDQVMRVATSDPWLLAHPPLVEFKDVGADGAEIPVEHAVVRTLVGAFERTTGAPPMISGRTGGADTRYLIKHGQTPTVIFGPGLTSEMHAIDESVPIANLIAATQVLAATIADWCGMQGCEAHG